MPAPKFRSNRKQKYLPQKAKSISEEIEKRDFEPYEMSDEIFQEISRMINERGLKSEKSIEYFVNHILTDRPSFYLDYKLYKKIYEGKKQIESGQKLLNKINELAEDMEQGKNFGLKVISESKKRKEGRNKEKEKGYNPIYVFLDEKIEEIELLIYLCVSPKRICMDLLHRYNRDTRINGLNPIIYEKWAEQTDFVDRLVFAFKKSATEHMFASQEFLLEWLDKEKHPELDMQHVGIVREVALWKSRMAGFLDRKKYGNKVEIVDDRPQQKVLDGKDLRGFLKNLDKIASKDEGSGEINFDEEDEDNEEENEYENDNNDKNVITDIDFEDD